MCQHGISFTGPSHKHLDLGGCEFFTEPGPAACTLANGEDGVAVRAGAGTWTAAYLVTRITISMT